MMATKSILYLILLLESLWFLTEGIRWLSIATVSTAGSTWHKDDQCDRVKGLVRKQTKLCKKYLDKMEAVEHGAREAIHECQHQFKHRRWNCSIINSTSVFGKFINTGTREAAFVHAISTAGVAHAITRACSAGLTYHCGCDKSVKGKAEMGFQWAGCSDNVAFGNAFAKTFVDARERRKGKKATKSLMNLHNNNAGRKTLQDNMHVECKCHGVSGSCEMKTCWRALPSFRNVGSILKDKFDGAIEVVQVRRGSRIELVPKNTQYKPHTDSDLVYLQTSPDFCDTDAKVGSLGTHDRPCNKTSKGMDGCELMCCGRGFSARSRRVVERCSCKFQWCCVVKCQTCESVIEEHVCR